MPGGLKKVRKGTKSCTECRRRKVRCTWSSDEAPKCRRCEERGSNCVAQIYSIQSAAGRRLTSKDRIARLEQQVSTLHKALQDEGKNGALIQPPQVIPTSEEAVESDSEVSEFASDSSDCFTRDPPLHLSNLFENDLISSDIKETDGHKSNRSKGLQELTIAVRHTLQELIPPKKEVDTIAGFASQWLSLFHSLFPAPSMIKSGQDMIENYEAVQSSSVDPSFLASWLLSIAMTIHQVPKGELGPENQLKGFRNAAQFSKSVSDAVEMTIMRHDVLLGTITGIDAAMLFLRLQLSRGNFKKTWLQLRRVIAVAELIGLHRAARRAEPSIVGATTENIWSDNPESVNARKAQVWESLCSVDRIAGMMFNLPPGTRRYRMPQYMNILSNGDISLRAYLCSLSEIAMRVQDLEDLQQPGQADAELYAMVLKIDGEMRVLASVTPASWWNNPRHLSDQLMQYWHFYITVRVHLPFTLRRETSEQFSFSRLACVKACQTLVQRYQILRGALPGGFFLCRIVDLQAFTALVVMILASHAATPLEKSTLVAQGNQPLNVLIPEILMSMKTIMKDPVAGYARQAVEAVTSLTQLLDGDNSNGGKLELKLKVPLLGKLHIRRKQPNQGPSQQQQRNFETNPNMNQAHAETSQQTVPNYSHPIVGNMDGMDDDYAWDPLSWSIEDDQSGVFQDALMAEDFSPFGSWWDPNGTELVP